MNLIVILLTLLNKLTSSSLQSGMIASKELVKDFQTVHDDGEALVKKLFDERVFSTEKSFNATIHRNTRGNFNRPPVGKIGPKASVSRAAVMENKAMAKVISLVEKCDIKLNLVQIMEYCITEECLSLFNANRTMVKVQKSKLVEKLNLIPFQTIDSYIALIDMRFIWRLTTPSPENRGKDDETHFTWLDHANKLFSLVMA